MVSGSAQLAAEGIQATLATGAFFSVPGPCSIQVAGRVVVITRLGFRGMLSCGLTETYGRLSYIDGCSTSILVHPPRLGDPTLNLLHIPAGTDQSEHLHPTLRVGVVLRGSGWAVTRDRGTLERTSRPLSEGDLFAIDPQEWHSFRTEPGRDALDVIAYHPDTDCGPTDQAHPMLTRTYARTGRATP